MSTKETTAGRKRDGNEAETSAFSPSGNAMAKLDLSDEQWDAMPDSVQIKIVRAVNAHGELLGALYVAEGTILRLSEGHGPFNSAQGTLDVIRAALAKAEAAV